ncbi:anti-sigma factor [Curtobacterium sp. PhB136]|uniref:anti-sigma factor n=1 Tax=Curtobacterium sp. PhB136 TaxID=2485181 RepID=UPI00104B5E3D|nr:anti-sigma factor [Curtobacterium sp. PhB136]TCK60156.1 anti-sigma-K factor rskA [Curtobacterium sp. PhB136]
MTHIDEETLALLAIGDVGPSGAEAEHLSGCAECRGELTDLRRVVTLAKSSHGVDLEPPSPRVWDRIATELGFEEQPAAAAPAAAVAHPAPGAAVPDVAPRRRVARFRRRTVLLVTAATGVVGLVLGLGIGAFAFGSRPDQPTTDAAVVSRTALAPLPGWTGAKGSAALERGSDGQLTLVIDVDPRAAEGDAPLREVWMMRGDLSGLVSVGFLDGDRGRFTVPTGVDPSRYPVVDVSAEPDDGDPAHSGDSVVRGTLRAGR